eukprot:scaffold16183_cov89-Phaeocystis_antarctica.AAC.1
MAPPVANLTRTPSCHRSTSLYGVYYQSWTPNLRQSWEPAPRPHSLAHRRLPRFRWGSHHQSCSSCRGGAPASSADGGRHYAGHRTTRPHRPAPGPPCSVQGPGRRPQLLPSPPWLRRWHRRWRQTPSGPRMAQA